MADVEEDGGAARCACGSSSFVLEAYLEVTDGRIGSEAVEAEALTCPECGREYEPVLLGAGKVARGDFLGFFEEEA